MLVHNVLWEGKNVQSDFDAGCRFSKSGEPSWPAKLSPTPEKLLQRLFVHANTGMHACMHVAIVYKRSLPLLLCLVQLTNRRVSSPNNTISMPVRLLIFMPHSKESRWSKMIHKREGEKTLLPIILAHTFVKGGSDQVQLPDFSI